MGRMWNCTSLLQGNKGIYCCPSRASYKGGTAVWLSNPASGCPATQGQHLPLTQSGLVAEEELCCRAPGLLLGQTVRKWGHLLSLLIGTFAPGRGPCCLCTGGQWICWRQALRSPATPSHVVKSPEIQDKNIRNSHFIGQYLILFTEQKNEPSFLILEHFHSWICNSEGPGSWRDIVKGEQTAHSPDLLWVIASELLSLVAQLAWLSCLRSQNKQVTGDWAGAYAA